MPRRVREQEEYQGPGAGRRPRRRSGNEGIWIALGAAVVLGLVFLLVVSGGSSGESEKIEAKKTLERFLTAMLANQHQHAIGMVHLEGMLVDYGPQILKNRSRWTPEDRKRTELDLYRDLRHKISSKLRLSTNADIRQKLLDRAEVTWDAYHDRVVFRWETEPYDTVIAERKYRVPAERWVAWVSDASGSWLVTKFNAGS